MLSTGNGHLVHNITDWILFYTVNTLLYIICACMTLYFLNPSAEICWKCTHPQSIQDVDEFVFFIGTNLEILNFIPLTSNSCFRLKYKSSIHYISSEKVMTAGMDFFTGSGLIRIYNPLFMDLFLTNMQLFKFSLDVNWWTGVTLWIIVFLSAVWTHSDGTHSLQRIHWWASDVMLNLSKTVLMKKQTHQRLRWPECKYIFRKVWFWVNCFFNLAYFIYLFIFGWS